MNYYIEKHDMEMVLDALEMLHKHIKLHGNKEYPYAAHDVDGLFQSLENSGDYE